MNKKAIIISIKSFELSKKEKNLFSREFKPWGLILFNRNIKSFKQVRKLISQIRKLTKDPNFPIIIDEEGKTVSRLRKITNNELSQINFGKVYKFDKKKIIILKKNYIKKII